MNNNLQTQVLVLKNKDQLWRMIKDAVEFAEYGSSDDMYSALEQIEKVTYVLRNCDYEGSED